MTAIPAISSVVRVLGDVDHQAGMGFVHQNYGVVTAAHVLNTALGRDRDDPSHPGKHSRVLIELRVGQGPKDTIVRRCSLQAWGPVGEWSTDRDVASLTPEEPFPPGIVGARLVEAARNESIHLCSPELTWAEAKLIDFVPGNLVQIDELNQDGFRVTFGWSGGPAWSHEAAGVVGILLLKPRAGQPQREVLSLTSRAICDILSLEMFDVASLNESAPSFEDALHTVDGELPPARNALAIAISDDTQQRLDRIENTLADLTRKLGRVERLAILPNFAVPSSEAVPDVSEIPVDLAGRRVLIRADIDVARRQSAHESHFKISRLSRTVNHLLARGAAILILGAQGLASVKLLEPINDQDLSWHESALLRELPPGTKFVRLSKFEDVGNADLEAGSVTLLPNLTTSVEEGLFSGLSVKSRAGDAAEDLIHACQASPLATTLRPAFDFFILDDFRSTVWTLPSNVGLCFGKERAVGLGLKADLRCLEQLVARCIELGRRASAQRICLLGSSRPEDLDVANTFLESRLFDKVMLGAIPSLLAYQAQGLDLSTGIITDLEMLARDTGASLISVMSTAAPALVAEYRERLVLPTDYIVESKSRPGNPRNVKPQELGTLPEDDRVMSIGPDTLSSYTADLRSAGLVFHFGMMGAGIEPYLTYTREVIRENLSSGAEVFMAGDHIVEIAHDLGLSSQLSGAATGAQTTSSYMNGTRLPGLVPFIKDSK